MKHFLIFLFVVTLFSCNKKAEENYKPSTGSIKTSVQKKEKKQQSLPKEVVLKKMNSELLQAIKMADYNAFANHIHPEKGVRFSMYAFTNRNEDKHFSKSDFQKYFPTKTIFTWGSLDGTGEVYQSTIKNYFRKWVFKKDFTHSNILTILFREEEIRAIILRKYILNPISQKTTFPVRSNIAKWIGSRSVSFLKNLKVNIISLL